MGQPRPPFRLFSSFRTVNLLSSQQDSNSDRRSRRQERWPLDHHHGPNILSILQWWCQEQVWDGWCLSFYWHLSAFALLQHSIYNWWSPIYSEVLWMAVRSYYYFLSMHWMSMKIWIDLYRKRTRRVLLWSSAWVIFNFFHQSSRWVSFGFSKSVLIDNRVEAAATFDPIDRIPRQTHR